MERIVFTHEVAGVSYPARANAISTASIGHWNIGVCMMLSPTSTALIGNQAVGVLVDRNLFSIGNLTNVPPPLVQLETLAKPVCHRPPRYVTAVVRLLLSSECHHQHFSIVMIFRPDIFHSSISKAALPLPEYVCKDTQVPQYIRSVGSSKPPKLFFTTLTAQSEPPLNTSA